MFSSCHRWKFTRYHRPFPNGAGAPSRRGGRSPAACPPPPPPGRGGPRRRSAPFTWRRPRLTPPRPGPTEAAPPARPRSLPHAPSASADRSSHPGPAGRSGDGLAVPREPPQLRLPSASPQERGRTAEGTPGEARPAPTDRPGVPAAAPHPKSTTTTTPLRGRRPGPAPLSAPPNRRCRAARSPRPPQPGGAAARRVLAPPRPKFGVGLPRGWGGRRGWGVAANFVPEWSLRRCGRSATFSRRGGRRSCGRSPAARSR